MDNTCWRISPEADKADRLAPAGDTRAHRFSRWEGSGGQAGLPMPGG